MAPPVRKTLIHAMIRGVTQAAKDTGTLTVETLNALVEEEWEIGQGSDATLDNPPPVLAIDEHRTEALPVAHRQALAEVRDTCAGVYTIEKVRGHGVFRVQRKERE